jgi:type IV pilus assembly protein PilM
MGILKRTAKAADSVVGLELDPGHIAAAEVSVNGAISLQRGAVAPLAPAVVRDGEVVDPVALAEALRTLFSENELPTRVRLGIANQRIVVRSLNVPVVQGDEALEKLVGELAPDLIPMPMDEVVMDFQPLGEVNTLDGPRLRVVVVAVRRELVERLHAACQAAGLEVAGIDLSPFAMVRALPPRVGESATLYVHAAGLLNVAVANADGCLFTRTAPGGVDATVANLCERRGLIAEHARGWMKHVGLAAPLAEIDGDAELVAATREALEDGVHQIADTVRNSLNFYRMQDSAEAVEVALLVGPAVEIPGFAARLSEQLQIPVEAASVAGPADHADLGRLTVAAGLAVEATP